MGKRRRTDRRSLRQLRLDVREVDALLRWLREERRPTPGQAAAALRVQAGRQRHAADQRHAVAVAARAAELHLGVTATANQKMAAVALCAQHVVGLAAGEGKTLAVLLAAFAASLHGPVHVATAEDHLAARDAAWAGPVLAALGVDVGYLAHDADRSARQRCFGRQVVYGAASTLALSMWADEVAVERAALTGMRCRQLIVDDADFLLVDVADVAPTPPARRWERERRAAGDAASAWQEPASDAAHPPRQHVALPESNTVDAQRHPAAGPPTADAQTGTPVDGAPAAATRHLPDGAPADGRPEGSPTATDGGGRQPTAPPAVRDREPPADLTADGALHASAFYRMVRRYEQVAGVADTVDDIRGELADLYACHTLQLPGSFPQRRTDHAWVCFPDRAAHIEGVRDTVVRHRRDGGRVLVVAADDEQAGELAAALRQAHVEHRTLPLHGSAARQAALAAAAAPGAVTVATVAAVRGCNFPADAAGSDLGGGPQTDGPELDGLCVIGAAMWPTVRLEQHLRARAGAHGRHGVTHMLLSADDPTLLACLPATAPTLTSDGAAQTAGALVAAGQQRLRERRAAQRERAARALMMLQRQRAALEQTRSVMLYDDDREVAAFVGRMLSQVVGDAVAEARAASPHDRNGRQSFLAAALSDLVPSDEIRAAGSLTAHDEAALHRSVSEAWKKRSRIRHASETRRVVLSLTAQGWLRHERNVAALYARSVGAGRGDAADMAVFVAAAQAAYEQMDAGVRRQASVWLLRG